VAQLIDQSPASDSPANASEDANLIHRLTSAWGGVPGECGVSCECGVTYDGFDTIAEAEKLLTEHISDAAIVHPAWCNTERCWAYENDDDNPPVGGYHESAPIVLDTLNPRGISLHLQLDHGDREAAPVLVMCTSEPDGEECKSLSLDQAAQLYHALAALLPDPDTLAALDGIKKRLDAANRQAYRAYALGWVDGMDGRAPEFEVAR
jgi:hypothetical protein